MTDPAFPLDGVLLVQVEPGTVLQQGSARFTVTDETAVFVGRKCFVTPANFNRITAEIERAAKAGE